MLWWRGIPFLKKGEVHLKWNDSIDDFKKSQAQTGEIKTTIYFVIPLWEVGYSNTIKPLFWDTSPDKIYAWWYLKRRTKRFKAKLDKLHMHRKQPVL